MRVLQNVKNGSCDTGEYIKISSNVIRARNQFFV